jgi:hypothetical protein
VALMPIIERLVRRRSASTDLGYVIVLASLAAAQISAAAQAERN